MVYRIQNLKQMLFHAIEGAVVKWQHKETIKLHVSKKKNTQSAKEIQKQTQLCEAVILRGQKVRGSLCVKGDKQAIPTREP